MTKEELLTLIETKVAQQGNQGASELAEILKEIVTNGIAPTVIDISTLEDGETYTADELAEIGLTQEVMQKIADNPSAFVLHDESYSYTVAGAVAHFDSTNGAFMSVYGGAGGSYGFIVEINGDKANGYTIGKAEL